MTKICVPLIMRTEYPKLRCGSDAFGDVLTDFNSIVLLATNIIEKTVKIVMFTYLDASSPLYEEKSTMFESINITAVNTKTKTKKPFLLSKEKT